MVEHENLKSDKYRSKINSKKNFLRRYRNNKNCIHRLNLKVNDIDSKMTNISAKRITDMPRGGIPITTDDMLSDKLELENRIDKLEEKGRKIKREILDVIDTLDDTRYIDILESYFIDCCSWEQIADFTGYEERHVRRLYYEAIEKLEFEPD